MNMERQEIYSIVQRLDIIAERMESTINGNENEKLNLYRKTLEETVSVLIDTKSAFHSKTLKSLREKIEYVLDKD